MIYSFELDYSNYSYISITVCVRQLFLMRNIIIFPCIYFPEKCYTHVRLEATNYCSLQREENWSWEESIVYPKKCLIKRQMKF